MGWVGSGRVGSGRVGLGWVGLDWIGLDWIGLGSVEFSLRFCRSIWKSSCPEDVLVQECQLDVEVKKSIFMTLT